MGSGGQEWTGKGRLGGDGRGRGGWGGQEGLSTGLEWRKGDEDDPQSLCPISGDGRPVALCNENLGWAGPPPETTHG